MAVAFKSRVNQPSRLFMNSNDDATQQSTLSFNSFTARFLTPVIGATKTQLLRATIPNATVSIPDYQCVFYYWNLPTATTVPNIAYLKAVRLVPSTYVPPTAFTTFTKNRYFNDPSDLVAQLNVASSAGGDALLYNTLWTAGDITFSYNATTKQISFTGNTGGRYYASAGWNDPIVRTSQSGNTDILLNNAYGGTTTVQPFVLGYTLNLRLGYAMSGTCFNNQGTQGTFTSYANLTNRALANTNAIPVDSFPNLVYTSCVYVYADIVAGSSIGSAGQRHLLSVIPSNAPTLGVIQYVSATLTWMDKIPNNSIYEITASLFDDANQPFNLPDSSVVNLELAFSYTD